MDCLFEREFHILVTSDGKVPFDDWLNSLQDSLLKSAVDARLTRIADGNFGDHKSVGKGVFELRIPKGSGLRVYYGFDGPRIVVLVGGGDKSTQKKDIQRVHNLWKEYQNAKQSL